MREVISYLINRVKTLESELARALENIKLLQAQRSAEQSDRSCLDLEEMLAAANKDLAYHKSLNERVEREYPFERLESLARFDNLVTIANSAKDKIEAIKFVRAITGHGLRDAKEWVEEHTKYIRSNN